MVDRTNKEYIWDLQHFLNWIRRKRLRPKLFPEEIDHLSTQFSVEEFKKSSEGESLEFFLRMNCALEFYVLEVKGKLT